MIELSDINKIDFTDSILMAVDLMGFPCNHSEICNYVKDFCNSYYIVDSAEALGTELEKNLY